VGKGLGFTVGNYFSSQDSKDMRFAYISGVQWVLNFNIIQPLMSKVFPMGISKYSVNFYLDRLNIMTH